MEPDAVPAGEYASAVQHFWYGSLRIPPRSELEVAWKAVKTIAAADGQLSEPEQLRLLGKMCAVLTPPAVIDAVLRYDERSASLDDLLPLLPRPDGAHAQVAAWIIYEAFGVAMADGELSRGETHALARVGRVLGLDHDMMDALLSLCREEALGRRRRIDVLGSSLPTTVRTDPTLANR